jgi:hypothetical protein
MLDGGDIVSTQFPAREVLAAHCTFPPFVAAMLSMDLDPIGLAVHEVFPAVMGEIVVMKADIALLIRHPHRVHIHTQMMSRIPRASPSNSSLLCLRSLIVEPRSLPCFQPPGEMRQELLSRLVA